MTGFRPCDSPWANGCRAMRPHRNPGRSRSVRSWRGCSEDRHGPGLRTSQPGSELSVSELVVYLVSFAPWIGYVVLTRVLNSWGDGYALGLGLAFAVVVWRTVKHDSRFMDVGTLAFCAVMTIVSLSDPTSPL